MAQTTILAAGSTAATSSDVTVAAGASVSVGLFSAAGIPKDIELPIYMDTPSLDAQVGVLTAKTPAIVLSGPGVFRVRREALANSVSVGVFADA